MKHGLVKTGEIRYSEIYMGETIDTDALEITEGNVVVKDLSAPVISLTKSSITLMLVKMLILMHILLQQLITKMVMLKPMSKLMLLVQRKLVLKQLHIQ